MSTTRTIDIDYDDLPQLRQRELNSFRNRDTTPDRHPRRDPNEEYEYRRRRYIVSDDLPRSRRVDYDRRGEQQLVPYNRNREIDVVAYDRRQAQISYDRTRDEYNGRRDYDEDRSRRSYDDGRSTRDYSERGPSRSRRDRRRNRRRDDYDQDRSEDEAANSADEGLLFYSGKRRGDGNFFEKNFDSSYEGITAAIAGGLIGGMTARRFGGEENNKAKVLAGTVVGAAALNAGENWYRVFTEERAERKAERRERRQDDRRD